MADGLINSFFFLRSRIGLSFRTFVLISIILYQTQIDMSIAVSLSAPFGDSKTAIFETLYGCTKSNACFYLFFISAIQA